MRVGPDPGCILANHLLDVLLGNDLLVWRLFEVADTIARRVPDKRADLFSLSVNRPQAQTLIGRLVMRAQRRFALKKHVIASDTWWDRLPQGVLTLPNPLKSVVQELRTGQVACLAIYLGRAKLDPMF